MIVRPNVGNTDYLERQLGVPTTMHINTSQKDVTEECLNGKGG